MLRRTKSELVIVGEASWLPQADEEGEEVTMAISTTNPEEKPEQPANPVQVELVADPTRSDRAIAALCGVSAPTVGKWRKTLIQQGLIRDTVQRVDRNGRLLEVSNIGKPEKPLTEKLGEMFAGASRENIDEAIQFLQSLK